MKNYIIQEIKSIQDIPDYKFTGYYWQSDRDSPEMLNEGVFPKEKFQVGGNPFCVEALLYSKSEKVSIHIQHTGEYLVHAYNLLLVDQLEVVDKSYIPNKLDKVEKVLFKQVWEEEDLVVNSEESMPTLKPSALIFVGFQNQIL
jgi:CRISPR type III-associated protein (TIGR04423 family)